MSGWWIREGKEGADFDGTFFGWGKSGGDGDGFIEVIDIDDVIAAELFSGFGEGAIGNVWLAMADANAGGGVDGMERGGGDPFALGFEFLADSYRLDHASGTFVFGPSVLSTVDEEHILHSSELSG